MARITDKSVGDDYERELDMVGAVATIGRNEGGGRTVTLVADHAQASADGPNLHQVLDLALERLRSKLARHYARGPAIDLDKLVEPVPKTETVGEVFGDAEASL